VLLFVGWIAGLNLLLVDDHELVRSGLKLVFETDARVESVNVAASGEECIPFVRNQRPDLIFMDIGLPGLDGFSTALRLLQLDEDLRIILLTGLEQRPLSRIVLQAGICGYMTKSSAPDEIRRAIDTVLEGGTYICEEILQQMALDSLKGDDEDNVGLFENLSRRELQVVLLLMRGHKPTVVGEMLFLSTKTVSTYKRRAYEKLNVESLAQLIELGIQYGCFTNIQ